MKRKICYFILFALLALGIAATQVRWSSAYMKLIGRFFSDPAAHSLPHPLPGQRFADTWHGARSGGRKHEGVDIFAKRGTPIHATTSGVVVKVGTNKLGGKVVSILAPNGRLHYYAHLEDYGEIKRHQWIEQGTIIGTVGDSGNAKGTPPHLHYGIYTYKGAINPYPLIKQ